MPIIGITCCFHHEKSSSTLKADYVRAVLLAGGTPVILPTLPPEQAPAALDGVKGLILSGGGDIDPYYLGEDPHPALSGVEPERDAFELALAKLALKGDLPLLGICRGCQVLAVAAGGSLFQHLEADAPGRIQHHQRAPRSYASHRVNLQEGSVLRSLVGGSDLRVNSFHHQAVKEVPPGFRLGALAPDGVIEAIESPRFRFILGLQWHPEAQVESCRHNLKIMEQFVAACR